MLNYWKFDEIDLTFVESELVNLKLTEKELFDILTYDALSGDNLTTNENLINKSSDEI